MIPKLGENTVVEGWIANVQAPMSLIFHNPKHIIISCALHIGMMTSQFLNG